MGWRSRSPRLAQGEAIDPSWLSRYSEARNYIRGPAPMIANGSFGVSTLIKLRYTLHRAGTNPVIAAAIIWMKIGHSSYVG